MAFSVIAASDVDADSPITDTLMNTIRTNFDDHETRISTNVTDIANSAGPFAAGGVLLTSADTEWSTYSTSYVKTKEFTLARGGALRIKFDLKNTGSGATGYARIYRNGVAVVTEQSVYQSGYVTFSEDISGWTAGDTCELWIKRNNGETYIQNFRIYASISENNTVTYDA